MNSTRLTSADRRSTTPYAVVVPSRGRPDKVRRLVESVLMSTTSDLEFVLVDQSDDTSTRDAVAPFLEDPRFRRIESGPHGASRGRNLGVAETAAPIVIMTDDDCIIDPDWIERMAKCFDDPRVGLAFCDVVPMEPSGTGHTPHVRFENDATLRSVTDGWRSTRRHAVMGAAMAARRTLFDEVGGFDELLGPGSLFPSCEDNDLMWRTLDAGWWVRLTPDLRVVHDGRRDSVELRDLIRRDCQGLGGALAKFLRRRPRSALPFAASVILRTGLFIPVRQVVGRRKPTSLRHAGWILGGIGRGLRTSVDPVTLRFVPGSSAHG